MRSAFRILVGKRKGKKPFMGTKCKWVGNIAMNIGDIQCENVTWIYLYEDSPVEGCYGL